MKNLIGIIAGDPESINSEIIGKFWKKKSRFKNLNIFIIGNFKLIEDQFKILKIKIKIKKINDIANHKFNSELLILDVPLNFKKPFQIPRINKRKYIISCLNLGIKLSLQKKIVGFINCPINKKEIFGDNNLGITEFLSKKLGVSGKEVMLIFNKKLSVTPITTHIKLKRVSKSLSKKKIIDKIITINNFYLKNFKFKPKIAILGLNPHNDEYRKDSEEKNIILPSIKKLRKNKISVYGPLSPDTAFINFKKRGFNVIVGMYHDQVLSPFKALFKFDAINITLGIPFLRISPDHGTGNDIIGKGLADSTSLFEAVKFFKKINAKT